MISAGVALASHGELNFHLFGFLTQAAAVAVRNSVREIAQTNFLLVRGLPLGNDSNSPPQPQDGSPRVFTLLRPCLRCHQSVPATLHGRAGAVLRTFQSRSVYSYQQCRHRLSSQRRGGLPGRCWERTCSHPRWRFQGMQTFPLLLLSIYRSAVPFSHSHDEPFEGALAFRSFCCGHVGAALWLPTVACVNISLSIRRSGLSFACSSSYQHALESF